MLQKTSKQAMMAKMGKFGLTGALLAMAMQNDT